MMVFCAVSANAQSTFNASGGSKKLTQSQHEYSIGEMAVIATHKNANLIITQGVLQPNTMQKPSAVDNSTFSNSLISIFPNPTSDVVNIVPNYNTSGKLVIRLTNLNGQLIEEKTIDNITTEKQQVSLLNQAAGMYLLHLQFTNAANQEERSFFKINKIN